MEKEYNFKPGKSGNPSGRPKGSKTQNTLQVQQAYIDLLNNNIHNLQIWLDKVALHNPYKALDVMIKLSAYVLPKKSEVELDVAEPITIIFPNNGVQDT